MPALLIFLLGLLTTGVAHADDCRLYEDDNRRNFCYAMTTGRASFCTNIDVDDVRLYCVALATQNHRACASIGDMDMRYRCRSSTRSDAPERGDEDTDCENITDGDYRRFCQARRDGDIELCGMVKDDDRRNYCKATLSKNRALCASIDAYDMRLRCHSTLRYGRNASIDAQKSRVIAADEGSEGGHTMRDQRAPVIVGREERADEDDGSAEDLRDLDPPAGEVGVSGADGDDDDDDDDPPPDDDITWSEFLSVQRLPNTSSCGDYAAVRDMWLICKAMAGHREAGAAYCDKIRSTDRHRKAFCHAVISDDHEDDCAEFAELHRKIGDVPVGTCLRVCLTWAKRDR